MITELTKEGNKNLTLVERLKLKRTGAVLLLDCSGSMASDCEPGLSKIQALRNIVLSLPGEPLIFWFNSHSGMCTKSTIPDPYASTYLAPALIMLKFNGHKNVVLITDGDINDKDATLTAMAGMTIKPMYVGAGARPAFLDKLASVSGGFAITEDLRQRKQLTDKVTLLLNPGGETKPRGAFEL
jgi:hypothetical protein